MNKLIFFFLLIIPLMASSQGFQSAFYADNPGVYAIGTMPSLLVDRSSKWDIHIIGTEFNFFNSDNSGQSFKEKLFASMFSSNPKEFLSVPSTFAFAEAQLALPTVSYAIDKNNTIGFSASLRSLTLQNNSGFSFYDMLESLRERRSFNGSFFEDAMTVYTNNWIELGITYARNWRVSDDWSLQTGVTLKYLSGLASGTFELNGLTTNFSNSETNNMSGEVALIYNNNIDKVIESGKIEMDLFSKNGFSFDLSLSAKWKDKMTFGLSFLDIGSINYTGSKNSSTYSLKSENLDINSFSGVSNMSQLADSVESQFSTESKPVPSFKTTLPFKSTLFVKYKLSDHFDLISSISYVKPFSGLDKVGKNSVWNTTIAPVYKIRKLSIIVPVAYSNYIRFRTGLGFQWSFLSIGSQNALSYYLTSHPSKAINIYCSLRLKVGKFD